MSYLDRLKETIKLTSPSGLVFIANWAGNPISMTNKVGIHEIPGVPGAKIQDQRSGALIYQLTIYFTGPDNDLNSTAFMGTLRAESGPWAIIHPVKGETSVVWTDATEQVQPTTSGNVTTVETNWIEDLEDSVIESAAQVQQDAEIQSTVMNATASEQFQNTARQTTAAEKQSIIGAVGQAITSAKKFLSLVENFQIIDPQLIAIAGAIENTLDGDIIDTSQLAGQCQQYVQLFGLGQRSATDAVTMFSNFVNEILKIVPDQANTEGVSTMAVTELFATSALTAAGQMGLIGGITSRPETVTTVRSISDMFETVTNSLDVIGAEYADSPIDTRYFSQSESYADSLLMASKSTGFLLVSIFGLPSERRIILKEDTAIPQIAHDEYGNVGNEDSETFYIDKLIESNELCGDDLYLLDAGREVLIYA